LRGVLIVGERDVGGGQSAVFVVLRVLAILNLTPQGGMIGRGVTSTIMLGAGVEALRGVSIGGIAT
jgi:hypothetical protein